METLTTVPEAIDELGALKVRIKELEAFLKTDEALEEFDVKANESKKALGCVFQATRTEVAPTIKNVTNWEAIAKKLNPSHQLIAANTEKDKVVRKGYVRMSISPRKDIAAKKIKASA